jgi:peptidoglycan/LPS O-acetylase OafA/YrhL
MDQNTLARSQRIAVLDGWRAISVGLVVVSHLVGISGLRIYFDSRFQGISLSFGQIGVEFFFVISGYVICAGMLRENRVNLAGFYIRRAFRILPPLVLYVAFIVGLSLIGLLPVDSASFVRTLTFTCNIGECAWPLGHTWSLAYEEQFYLLFPVILILFGGGRREWTLALGVAMAAALLLLYWYRAPIGVSPLRHFFSITCGVLAAMFADRVFSFLRRIPWPLIVGAGLLPFIVQLGPWNSRLVWFGYLVCVGPAITIAVLGSASHPRLQFLAWPPLTAVGRASFGIYLWQQLVTSDFGTSSIALYAALLIALGIGVWLLFTLVERPLIEVGRQLSQRAQSRTLQLSIV